MCIYCVILVQKIHTAIVRASLYHWRHIQYPLSIIAVVVNALFKPTTTQNATVLTDKKIR